MPWQQYVADVALEVDEFGNFVYRYITIVVPRQSGKTTLSLSLSTHRCLAWPVRQLCYYAAQDGNNARQKWKDDFVLDLEDSVFDPLFRVRQTNGAEAVLWKNGSRFAPIATTPKSGHGFPLDFGWLDEAWAQKDDRVEQAWRPAMVTKPNAQMYESSTVGDHNSLYLRRKCDQGRQAVLNGVTEKIAYFEWSAPDDADPGSPETWRKCMPALGHTITESVIQAEFDSLPLAEFRRAYLNQWPSDSIDAIIRPDWWTKATNTESRRRDVFGIGFDVALDRSSAAIAIVGLNKAGKIHGEVIEHRPGTAWLSRRVKQLAKKHRMPVAFDRGGPAGSFEEDLSKDEEVETVICSTRELAAACGSLLDAIRDGTFTHIGQEPLDAAAAAARPKPVGDGFIFHRKGEVDTTPLLAVTVAFRAWQVATRDEANADLTFSY